MEKFDIIEYLSSLANGFVFDTSVYKRIAMERGVLGVSDFQELSERDRDLLQADILYAAYLSPTSTASLTKQHGAFSQTIGSQSIQDRKGIYSIMASLYEKWEDPKLDIVKKSKGGLRWLCY